MSIITTLGMKDGDLALIDGVIATDSDMKALANKIDCALSTLKGELDDESLGVDYYNIILSNVPMSMKIRELSRVIYGVQGVTEVTYLSSEKNTKTGELKFRFSIGTIFGTMDYEKTISNI